MSIDAVRSWLYVPGHDEKKIEKATSARADVVILDLEDGTPRSQKDRARRTTARALTELDFGASRRYVRLNATTSPAWRDDITATLAGEPDGYVVPKASSPEAVQAVAKALREDRHEPPPLAPILTEDAIGFFAAQQTAGADTLVDAVLWGSEDLSADLGSWAVKDEDGSLLDPFSVVRSLFLLTAAAHARPAIDTPYLALQDPDGLRAEACASARMGFVGKQCIHPAQVETVNAAFTPNAEQVRAATALIEAFEADGDAVVRLDDQMADAPHYKLAKQIISAARVGANKDDLHARRVESQTRR